jgi:hypothetical protein
MNTVETVVCLLFFCSTVLETTETLASFIFFISSSNFIFFSRISLSLAASGESLTDSSFLGSSFLSLFFFDMESESDADSDSELVTGFFDLRCAFFLDFALRSSSDEIDSSLSDDSTTFLRELLTGFLVGFFYVVMTTLITMYTFGITSCSSSSSLSELKFIWLIFSFIAFSFR